MTRVSRDVCIWIQKIMPIVQCLCDEYSTHNIHKQHIILYSHSLSGLLWPRPGQSLTTELYSSTAEDQDEVQWLPHMSGKKPQLLSFSTTEFMWSATWGGPEIARLEISDLLNIMHIETMWPIPILSPFLSTPSPNMWPFLICRIFHLLVFGCVYTLQKFCTYTDFCMPGMNHIIATAVTLSACSASHACIKPMNHCIKIIYNIILYLIMVLGVNIAQNVQPETDVRGSLWWYGLSPQSEGHITTNFRWPNLRAVYLHNSS